MNFYPIENSTQWDYLSIYQKAMTLKVFLTYNVVFFFNFFHILCKLDRLLFSNVMKYIVSPTMIFGTKYKIF